MRARKGQMLPTGTRRRLTDTTGHVRGSVVVVGVVQTAMCSERGMHAVAGATQHNSALPKCGQVSGKPLLLSQLDFQ